MSHSNRVRCASADDIYCTLLLLSRGNKEEARRDWKGEKSERKKRRKENYLRRTKDKLRVSQ